MTTFVISEDLDKRLTEIAKKLQVSKDELVARGLEQALEDGEDYLAAVAELERMEREGEKSIPFEEILEKYREKHGASSLDDGDD